MPSIGVLRRYRRCVRAHGLLAACAGVACGQSAEDPDLPEPLPVDGAVSTDTPEATQAGLAVLARGGNAVDAAVAISFVLGVSQPSESGIGGSVLMLIVPHGRGGVVVAGGGAGDATAPDLPDALRVLHHAWSRYGSGNVTWPELLAPAIAAASNGFALGHFSHRTIVREYDRIVTDRAAALQLLASDRSIPAEGSVVTNAAAPQSCSTHATRSAGAAGSIGTYAAPAFRIPRSAA